MLPKSYFNAESLVLPLPPLKHDLDAAVLLRCEVSVTVLSSAGTGAGAGAGFLRSANAQLILGVGY